MRAYSQKKRTQLASLPCLWWYFHLAIKTNAFPCVGQKWAQSVYSTELWTQDKTVWKQGTSPAMCITPLAVSSISSIGSISC